jgi:hypothetical protein
MLCQFLLPAYFVVPYGCVYSVQFSFGVLVLEDLFCLFGLTEFDVHGSVHLGNICSIKGPTRCTYHAFFIPSV